MSISAKVERVDVVEGGAPADTMSSLKARFSQFSEAQHAEYTITVTMDGETYQIRKRFSQFAALHDTLKARFGNLPFDLPAKTPIRYFNPDKLEDRKNGLNVYLKELCQRGDICAMNECRNFFSQNGAAPLAMPGASNSSSTAQASGGGYAPRPYQPPLAGANKVAGNRFDEDDDLVGWDN
mmetsp:Transcript_113749/g.178985  ORF Transcript_113749/g.178985 Transcript_113749/m.178985 type:complete len:181 (-) Transcript_113749:225-767(-)|eukprot:CAMPEP_0169085632 /NCGR_PEP_ID=MMETSP1015-20121227/13269_1 /TAXON_ID=342587 /ORGANISM="Karlodinium micrum, Strain CCMP2283" /LENGTH=180 /DNA_ID=CAMNT_0009145743 /DNA_START=60 /DNA_END=602 /DNA_ORIENTATION=-